MLKKIGRFILKAFVGFILLSVLSVILFRFVPIPVTPLMLIRCVQQATSGKPMSMYKDWQPISKISPHLQLAVVASEDQTFPRPLWLGKEVTGDARYYNSSLVKTPYKLWG